jgi:hypothetical protein
MSAPLELTLRLNGPQLGTHAAIFAPDGSVNRGRSVFTGWGRGVGKTHYARSVWWLLVALYDFKLRTEAPEPFRGVRINSLCPTLKQWKEINEAGIQSELAPDGKWGFLRGRYNAQSGHVSFPGGSYVRPFPAMEHRSTTARGMRTDVLDAEELDDIDANVYDGVAIPWLSEPWSLGLELLRGTPTRGRFGLWYRTLAMCRLGEKIRNGVISFEQALELPEALAVMTVFEELPADEWPPTLPRDPQEATLHVLRGYYGSHATYRDAPETVSPMAVARAKATTPAATFDREWNANPDAGEGLVYPFVAEPDSFGFCHVQEAPPLSTFREFHIGMDHGYSDPGVLLLFGVQGHGEDATLWLLDEQYEREVPNDIWNARAKNWSFGKFWPDPSRPDRVHDIRNMGIEVGEVDNDIQAGISRLANLMFVREAPSGQRYSRFYVSPKCKNTIAEFGKYRRKKLPDGSFDEKPEDKWNHAMDSARYVAVGRFGRIPNTRHVSSGR